MPGSSPWGPPWHEFSIIVKERHVPDLEKIVQLHESDHAAMGYAARQAFENYFSEKGYFNFVIDNCLDMRDKQLIPEAFYWRLNPLILAAWKAIIRIRIRSRMKDALRLGASS